MAEQETLKEGYIYDYISGLPVKATPEETEATQIFSKILVEDYGYPKEHIQTRPQFHVKVRPSDTKKEYPVDIAVFSNSDKTDDNLFIIVECKKKNRKDGRKQLENYMTLSSATLGVWFNGEERFYLHKHNEKDGKVIFTEIPNIPRFNERLEDIGALKRKDLLQTHNLKSVFKAIRNYLAANNIGATRDEVLAQQLINIIFCKIYDERFTPMEDTVNFRIGLGENVEDVDKRIKNLFRQAKSRYPAVFSKDDEINLDANSIAYIVGELQNYCLIDAQRDVLADAFETFISHALKGGQGQFFTPRNVVKMMVEILNPTEDDLVIDPACGSGGFLIESLRHIWKQQDEKYKALGWSNEDIIEEKKNAAVKCIHGIDKDSFLAKITKSYMVIMGDGKGGIFCEDSLEREKNWNTETSLKIRLNSFDVVLTNPPFGSKIPVTGEDKLKQYELAHKWKNIKDTNNWEKMQLSDKESPQILFIERDLQLLKDGGRMAIVLPDGIFGNSGFGYIRDYIIKHTRLVAVIDIPIETFMPNTGTKTSILVVQKMKKIPKDYSVFMCVAETCGHDRRGNETEDDDISQVAEIFKQWCIDNNFSFKDYGTKDNDSNE